MLTGTCQIDGWTTRHISKQCLKRLHLIVRMDFCNPKSSLEIVFVYLLECGKYLACLSAFKVINGSELDLSAQSEKEHNLVHIK
jgi:hypothetical protein